MEIGSGVELRERNAVARRLEARELRALVHGRCFGGGGSSSSSASTTTSNVTNVDRRQVVDGSAVGVTSDSSTVNTSYNVTALDGGSIAGAFDFAKKVADGGNATAGQLLDITKGVFSRAFDQLDKQQSFVSSAGQAVAAAYDNAKGDGTQKFILAVGIIGSVAAIGLAVAHSRGKA